MAPSIASAVLHHQAAACTLGYVATGQRTLTHRRETSTEKRLSVRFWHIWHGYRTSISSAVRFIRHVGGDAALLNLAMEFATKKKKQKKEKKKKKKKYACQKQTGAYYLGCHVVSACNRINMGK